MKKLVSKIAVAAAGVMLVCGGLLVMPKEVKAEKTFPPVHYYEKGSEFGTCPDGSGHVCFIGTE